MASHLEKLPPNGPFETRPTELQSCQGGGVWFLRLLTDHHCTLRETFCLFVLYSSTTMPSVEVDLPMGDAFHAYHHSHINQSQTCFQDNAPFFPSSVYLQPSRPRRSQGSLSFLPSTTYLSDITEQPSASLRRPAERAPVYISPFRSVRQMKEPFQLKLPHSPSFESNSSSSSKESKDRPRALQSPIGLRPLRSCRSDQNLVAGALESFGLLPSPSLSDSRVPSKLDSFPLERHIESEDKQGDTSKCSCTPQDPLCELCVVSSYEGQMAVGSDESSENTDILMETLKRGHEENINPYENSAKPVPPLTEDNPSANPVPNPTLTPLTQFTELKASPGSSAKSKKRTRTGTVSSAASWVPGNLSYCEAWLQAVPLETPERKDEKARETNRRKCQIVQQIEQDSHCRKPVNLRIDTQAANNVMFAVASKTKPKLVDISRPSSSATAFSVPIHPPPSWRRPSTPERRSINEISAFSPDTPQEIPDSGYVTQQSNHSSKETHGCREEDYGDCMLRAFSEALFTGDVTFDTNIFGENPHSRNRPIHLSQKTRSPPEKGKKAPVRTPPMSPKTVDQETIEKWWDYEWTLDQLDVAIKEFPKLTLRLTSPVVILLRQNHEKALLRPFRKIFPGVPDNLLDYLCAALIARNYLVAMASTHHRHNSSLLQPLTNLSRLDSVPEKARATLGINLPSASQFQITERLMGTRSLELRKSLDRIVDKLIYSICGRSDETLKAAVVVLTQVLESKALLS